jgi:hypothetical protein
MSCRALKDAYAQVNTLAIDDTVHRLIKVLIGGSHQGYFVIDTGASSNQVDGRKSMCLN